MLKEFQENMGVGSDGRFFDDDALKMGSQTQLFEENLLLKAKLADKNQECLELAQDLTKVLNAFNSLKERYLDLR